MTARDAGTILRQYTSFNNDPTTPSKPVSKVLQHWHIDRDPSDYDYIATVAAIEEAAGEEMAPSDKEKQKRRRVEERRRKRDETIARKRTRLALDSQANQPSTSAAVTHRTPASSTERPQEPLSKAQSQQDRRIVRKPQSQSSSQPPVAASQVIAGRFGDRLAFRGKRRAGF